MKITNNRDFRIGYEILHWIEERMSDPDGYTKRREDHLVELKREIRRWANRDTREDVGLGFLVERRIVKDEGMEGFVELLSIPEVFDTKEDAEEFFNNFIQRECRPSMYDCTGQAFTCWHRIFRRHGQFWCYHRVGFDF